MLLGNNVVVLTSGLISFQGHCLVCNHFRKVAAFARAGANVPRSSER